MRVIAGELKGRIIKPVKGMDTRPTTDKIKENIFNIIGPYFEGGLGLDLFGGSGNLGIEAISRGVDKVIFTDKQHQAVATIKQNLADLKIEDRAEVYKNDAYKSLKTLADRGVKFDIIFLDPPYKGQKINEIITFVHEHDMLAEYGIIMAECLKEDVLMESIADIDVIRRVEYGITAITIYQKG